MPLQVAFQTPPVTLLRTRTVVSVLMVALSPALLYGLRSQVRAARRGPGHAGAEDVARRRHSGRGEDEEGGHHRGSKDDRQGRATGATYGVGQDGYLPWQEVEVRPRP